MDRAVQPLVARMKKADRVHIKGPGPTDLKFSIKNVGAVPCSGERNIPDGECFTAPIRDSVEGILQYNTPTLYQGCSFANIRFEFVKGKIIKATCDGDQEKLNSILDSDEGARYIGEFSLGFNPAILTPMQDTLFDEKIAGSFHFTQVSAMKRRKMEIEVRCTGTLFAYSDLNLAAEPSHSMTKSFAKMGAS